MLYYIGQFFGVLVAIGSVVMLQLKKKKHILLLSGIVNAFGGLNILLIDKFSSGVIIYAVAVLQIALSLWHESKSTSASVAEKVIFALLYVAGGAAGYEKPIDLLTVAAALLYMLAMFQKKEQHIRIFMLMNMSVWLIYYIFIGSTAIVAQIAGITSTLIALYRYRKNKNNVA